MKDPDSRTFVPPELFTTVCNFAIRETMCSGVGLHGEFDYTVSDCLTVAMLYPKNPTSFRLPAKSGLACLYNSYADLRDKIAARTHAPLTQVPRDYVSES